MKYNISINLKEIIISSLDINDHKELIDYITYDCLDKKGRKEYISKLLNDYFETETEFDNRINVIEAIKTLIKSIE